ncbi:glycosyltransferase [soil metagenome]
MSKILFLNQPSIGHLNTLLTIALQMREDGHSVRFLVPGWDGFKTRIQILDTALKIPQTLRGQGIEVDLIPPPFSVVWQGLFLPLKSGYAELLHAVNIMSLGIASYARRILPFRERERPDAMVVDFSFLGGSLAAEIAKIPYAVVYHSGLPFRGKGIPPFGSGLPINGDQSACKQYEVLEEKLLAKLTSRVNAARRAWSLPSQQEDILRRPASPWLNLVTSVSAAEAPRDNLTANTMFVGPCFGKRGASAEFPFDKLRADRFKVYVSLGTVFNNKPQVFRKILEALDSPAYQVIVSAGAAYEKLQRGPIPSNALLFKSVPQVELLARIDMFISHGGNNSINEALAAGKPIIVLPIGGEQADNASRIIYLGVGRKVDTQRFTAEDLRTVAEELRTNSSFAERAQEISRAIGATQGAVTASRCIERIARNHASLERPAGLGPTIAPDDVERLIDRK